MGTPFAVFLVVIISAAAYLSWSAAKGSRSPLPVIVAVAIATLAGLGSWYAWVESQSAPWAAGYLVAAVASLAAAATGWVRGGNPANRSE